MVDKKTGKVVEITVQGGWIFCECLGNERCAAIWAWIDSRYFQRQKAPRRTSKRA